MNESVKLIKAADSFFLPSNVHHLSSTYLDIHSGNSSVGTVLVPIHSAQHSVEVSDVHCFDVDLVVAVAPVAVAVVESPHSWAFVGFALEVAVFALPIQFVAVDLNNVLHDL